MSADKPRADRLDTVGLRKDAEQMLRLNSADPAALVAQLLRHIRQNDDVQEAIRRGYSHTSDWFRDELNNVERRTYLDAVRIVRSMEPAGNTQLTYGGAKRQAERRLRMAARWIGESS